ncbi:hypothetical protein [Streptomyces sp. NRRL B-24484]|uniref:hypothetical protein n=1 Tax=Streptomyces sp. NRRL B-24484 TaxID=1463833 RepID=UPI0004C1F681|nr:hypothetical protein [Streptomyces sp. NRRL B-24484]
MTTRSILHVRLHQVPFAAYGETFTLFGDITPAVQALPPDAVLLDVTGALGYFRRTPEGLADLIATRLLARFGLLAAIGGGDTRSQRVRRFLRQIRPEVAGQSAFDPALVHRVRVGSAVGRSMRGTGWPGGDGARKSLRRWAGDGRDDAVA